MSRKIYFKFFAIGIALVIGLLSLIFSFNSLFDKTSAVSWLDTYNDLSKPSGMGTSENPYLIEKEEHLVWLAYNTNNHPNFSIAKHFKLCNNLDLSGKEWIPIGTNLNPFAGNFEGGGFSITNLLPVSQVGTGLFGFISSAKILNLTVYNANELNYKEIVDFGGIVGVSVNLSEISNCMAQFNISTTNLGSNIGGILGRGSANISSCSYQGQISNSKNVGGIIGKALNSKLYNCNSIGFAVNCSDSIGGIIGVGENEEIISCNSEFNLSASQNIGGIIGLGNARIDRCFAEGEIRVLNPVNSLDYFYSVSSFVGKGRGEISNSYAQMNIFCTPNALAINKFGGPEEYTMFNCYNTIELTIQDGAGGVRTKTYKGTNCLNKTNDATWVKDEVLGTKPILAENIHLGQFMQGVNINDYFVQENFDTSETFKIQKDSEGYFVNVGQYPQSYVGDEMSRVLTDFFPTATPIKAISNYEWYNDTYEYEGEYYTAVGRPTGNYSGSVWFKVEPVKWRIVNMDEVFKGNAPICMSEFGLTGNVPWNVRAIDGNIWSGKCLMRTWLREHLMVDMFNVVEKERLMVTTVKNNKNSNVTDGTGSNTQDQIWLPSYNEITGKYISNNNQSRVITLTDYARATNASGYWWTRSAKQNGVNNVHYAKPDGSIGSWTPNYQEGAIRPLIRLNLDNFYMFQ